MPFYYKWMKGMCDNPIESDGFIIYDHWITQQS